MPIIKDKYGAKGSKIRSKFQTRKINKAIINPVLTSETGIETQQSQESFNKQYRESIISKEAASNLSSIGGYNFTSANTANLIFTLSPGESLNDVIIHNYNASAADNNIQICWSVGDQKDASFTISSGIVTAVAGISITRLFASEFPYLGTVTIGHVVRNIFTNVNKKIYFYGVSAVAGPSITFSKISG
jgi:hypothetical protein